MVSSASHPYARMTIGWLGLRRVAKYRVLEGGAHNGVSKFCFKASTQSGTLVREGEQHAFDLMMSGSRRDRTKVLRVYALPIGR